jgi:hypothetical protein
MKRRIALMCVLVAVVILSVYAVCVSAQDQPPARDEGTRLQPPDQMTPRMPPDFMRTMRSMNAPVAMQVEGNFVYVVKADLLLKFDSSSLALVAKSKIPLDEDARPEGGG